MSKEETPIEELVIRLADLYTDLGNAKRPDQGMKLVSIITKEIEQYAQYRERKAVLEALGEVDKYCDGKISHFSKAPMDLQGIHATREVKTYLNILRNRSKT